MVFSKTVIGRHMSICDYPTKIHLTYPSARIFGSANDLPGSLFPPKQQGTPNASLGTPNLKPLQLEVMHVK